MSGMVAGLDREHVTGMHVVTDPLTAASTATFLPGMADRLDENDPVDKLILERMEEFRREGSGYLAIQNSRPQTIGYGLADSPPALPGDGGSRPARRRPASFLRAAAVTRARRGVPMRGKDG